MSRYLYGKDYVFRMLEEFSLTDMKVEVLTKTEHALSSKELEEIDEFSISDLVYSKMWQRHESDERGAYTAVGLTCNDLMSRVKK